MKRSRRRGRRRLVYLCRPPPLSSSLGTPARTPFARSVTPRSVTHTHTHHHSSPPLTHAARACTADTRKPPVVLATRRALGLLATHTRRSRVHADTRKPPVVLATREALGLSNTATQLNAMSRRARATLTGVARESKMRTQRNTPPGAGPRRRYKGNSRAKPALSPTPTRADSHRTASRLGWAGTRGAATAAHTTWRAEA